MRQPGPQHFGTSGLINLRREDVIPVEFNDIQSLHNHLLSISAGPVHSCTTNSFPGVPFDEPLKQRTPIRNVGNTDRQQIEGPAISISIFLSDSSARIIGTNFSLLSHWCSCRVSSTSYHTPIFLLRRYLSGSRIRNVLRLRYPETKYLQRIL